MSAYTWQQQRNDIQHDIDEYFGRSIEICPRAMAALQSGETWDRTIEDEARGVFAYSIIQSLLKCSPAVSMTLFSLGVEIERMEFHPSLDQPAPLGQDTLDWVFRGFTGVLLRRHRNLVTTGKNVRRCGVLTELDLLLAPLEASLRGTDLTPGGGLILEGLGVVEPGHYRGASQCTPSENRRWKTIDSHLRSLIKRIKQIPLADPSHSLIQFMLFVDERDQVRVRPFGAVGVGTLPEPPLADGTQYVYRGGILQPVRAVIPGATSDAIAALESLLNNCAATEGDYQKLFEKYPFFLLGLDWARAHPQPILYEDDGGTLIPDFFLEKLSSTWNAILDLKKPYDAMVVRRRNRTYFNQEVQNAVAQLRYYREWFDSKMNRRRFAEIYGVSTFRPKMVIVIGRDHAFLDDAERVRLVEGLPQHLDLWTYDDVLRRARRYLELVRDFA